MQAALAGFEGIEAPAMRDRRGLAEWRVRIRMRDVFDVVEQFFADDPVREACKAAVGRPRVQREVINRYFFDEESVRDIAESRDVSPSTIYNHKAVAQKTMQADDVFFSALQGMSAVRDPARAQRIADTYPDGVMPDGRRIVVIAA